MTQLVSVTDRHYMEHLDGHKDDVVGEDQLCLQPAMMSDDKHIYTAYCRMGLCPEVPSIFCPVGGC